MTWTKPGSGRRRWNVALWLGNDEPLYRQTVAYAKRNPKLGGVGAKHYVTHTLGWTETPDGCKLGRVDWPAIAERIRELAS